MGYQALLFCPDEKTARTVTHVLNDLDFSVEPCTEPFAAVKKLMAQHFDAVVVDCDNEQNATLLFKSARNSNANQSSLAVAVVEGQAGVAKAFRIGANLVLTKPINVEQAKGTLRVARGLLRKGADAKGAPPASDLTAAPTPTASSTALPATPTGLAPTGPAFAASRPNAPAGRTPSGTIPKPAPAPKAQAPVQTTRPQTVSPPMASTPAEVEDHEPDTILEPDEAEVLEVRPAPAAKPASPPPPAPAAGTPKFPWQPTAKPSAQPMASALRRAAEAAAQIEPAVTAPAMGPGYASAEDRLAASSGMSGAHGAAAAPAPAKEKPQPLVSGAAVAPALSKPAFHESEVSTPRREDPPVIASASSSSHETPPPTFFPGAYDPDEVEGGGKTKALIIVAAVVLLACSAAFLSWRNVNRKNSPEAPSTQSAPEPASATPTSNVSKPPAQAAPIAGPEVSPITLGGGAAAASAPTAKPSPTKPVPQESAAATEAAAEPEVTQTIIVKNDTRRMAQPAAPPQDQETVQPPSVEINAAPDPKALAGISSTAAAVPTPSAQVVKVSQGVMEGLILKRVQPRYPAQAMQMRIQGAVQLQATISKTGDITNLKVTSGDGILARAAQEAVRQWKYKPYFLNGDPVEIQTQILVNFKLPN